MNIEEFVKSFKNHPVLFIGTGMSLRYLENSYTWDGLLDFISFNLAKNHETYLDIKSHNFENGEYQFDKIASELESIFNCTLENDRNGEFKDINDIFYKNMVDGKNISRFKLYISKLLSECKLKSEMQEEIDELKRVRKNISSIITTNYDQFVEKVFEFKPLIGNDILLSNPYGSVYKIHGSVTSPEKIIITEEDYNLFEKKYELIRAQLLSIFIHNPIVFLGYSIRDNNIRNLLKTIFEYVPEGSELGKKIKSNFLIVEYEKGNINTDVNEYDISLDDHTIIRVNKIKTDNFLSVYKSISSLQLPISAMDIRKVQSVVKQIYEGGSIKVNITEDIDKLDNADKVVAIGTVNTVHYEYKNTSDMIENYFTIIEEDNKQLLDLINYFIIQKNQYFPIFVFSKINTNIKNTDILKENQANKVIDALSKIQKNSRIRHSKIEEITNDSAISKTNKCSAILYGLLKGDIKLNDLEDYLKQCANKRKTEFRRLLCVYDLFKYADQTIIDKVKSSVINQ